MATETVPRATPRVVIATSVMLSFISFWRAAAIVLNDLGSSAYYVGGIAEKAAYPSAVSGSVENSGPSARVPLKATTPPGSFLARVQARLAQLIRSPMLAYG